MTDIAIANSENFSIKAIPDSMMRDDRYVLPEGQYIIIDPSYVVPDSLWKRLMDSEFNLYEGVFALINGRPLVAFGTAYGDGVYEDEDGVTYPVDAGLIGAVPKELLEEFIEVEGENAHYDITEEALIDLDDESEAYEDNGVLHFGEVTIDTN